jgi:large subunit ribosomal protein L4
VLDSLELPEIKTKEMVRICGNLKTGDALFVIEQGNKNAVLSARNIPWVQTAGVNTINVYDILNHDMFFVTKEAVGLMQEVYA